MVEKKIETMVVGSVSTAWVVSAPPPPIPKAVFE
jgi:hypothetical protein